MIFQCTLGHPIKASGVGVHTGKNISLTLSPANPGTGIVFRRIDLTPSVSIPATLNNVGDTSFNTCLTSKEGVKIATIEHLMSALSGLGIDNAYVDLTGAEVPIMDGSAGPFVFLIQSAGVKVQNVLKKFIRIKKKVKITDGDKWAMVEPYEGFKVSIVINFEHPIIQKSKQAVTLDFSQTSYIKICRARTFGFHKDLDYMMTNDLALGANLENTLALDDSRIMNEGGLRLGDEFALHKSVDAIGDLALLNHPMIGAYSAYKPGHSLNNLLLNSLMADASAWEIVTFEDANSVCPPVLFQPYFKQENHDMI